MVIETHDRAIVEPSAGEIAPLVATLTDPLEAFVVLGDDSDVETYVQAAGDVNNGFIVERRDGSAGEHYRGDRRLDAGELGELLAAYLAGETTWSDRVSWHRVRVDVDSARA